MNKDLKISRELAERLVLAITCTSQMRPALDELRALLANPGVGLTAACTSCDGSGEYVDAIGDWRGYCSCPAGIALKNRAAVRPKYVKCIAHPQRTGLSWCNLPLEPFHFVGADHAALNGEQQGRLVACRDCTDQLTEALTEGQTDE